MQLQLQKYHSMVASDTIRTESSVLNHSNYSEPASVSQPASVGRNEEWFTLAREEDILMFLVNFSICYTFFF